MSVDPARFTRLATREGLVQLHCGAISGLRALDDRLESLAGRNIALEATGVV